MTADTAKDAFIERELSNSINSFTSSLLLIASLFILFLGILDYFVTPENFSRFFVYRIAATSIYLLLYVAFKILKKHANIFIILAAVVVSSMIERMILSFGGHQSPYYAGMIVVFMFLFGLLPISFRVSLIIAGIIYTTYVVPILLFDNIDNMRIFINNNMFLLATIIGGLVWRYFNYRLYLHNLSLQYELKEQKKHLEIYSLQLAGMVEDRTQELRKSNQWHQSLFENATDGIIVTDTNGIIVNANERACEMHGFTKETMIGTHSRLMEVNENRHKTADLLERLLKGESLVYETTHFRKDGTHFQLEVSAKAIPIADEYYIQSFLRDITEKKKIQAHLFQSQKMESIGMLAGGIAHDFNNILTAILGYTVVIRKEVGANEKVLGKLTIIENAARKAGRLVSQLLGFSRKSELERVTVHMNDIVQDTVKLLERAIDKRIEMKLDLEPGLPPVEGDYNQLEQAIMNFVVNARDAMPYGGVITIATASKYIEPGMPDIPPYIPTGRYVIVKVQDTGVGIPEEIQQKIFEPFFTTKERGKGTGLGLAMVYGVITEHKGFLTVQSKVNEGTTFTVFLPVSVKAVVPAARKAVPLAARGTETVLVVDDEEDALSNMQETLEQGGYKVIATTNPLQALEAYKKMHSEISLVIIDIVMPLIDGRGLMKQIIDVDPAARFLTVSGFSRYAEQPDDVKPDMFLPKPFDPAELLAAVRRILDRGKALHAL